MWAFRKLLIPLLSGAAILIPITSARSADVVSRTDDESPLVRLYRAAEASNTDGMVVYRRGRRIASYSSGRHREPICIMSCTKAILGIAVVMACQDGAIEDLSVRVADRFPEYPAWQSRPKHEIRLQHILDHTSDLRTGDTTEDIYRQHDFVHYALE